jgi:uncharacterized glyoxalase superfamily protein PhnB
MARKRKGEPWMPADKYGRSLPAFTVNLLVSDMAKALRFYEEVLEAKVRYSDPDFAALRIGKMDFMLHADHTYEAHPWAPALAAARGSRGLGAELRLLGIDPDGLAVRARAHGARVLGGPADKKHGWREIWIRDPEGYVWAAGVAIGEEPQTG